MRKLLFFLLPAAAGAMLLVAFDKSAYWVLWAAAGWLTSFTICALLSRTSLAKTIFFNLAFCFFLAGAVETYSALALHAKQARMADTAPQTTYSQNFFTPHPDLGYAPRKDITVEVKKTLGTHFVYQVSYTIDPNGLRTTPKEKPIKGDHCILFFGGSFTFGEGVEDFESLPHRVGQLSRCQTYNFGLHGYGPHHMLAAIEKGLVAKTIDCRPQLVFYQAVLDHVSRVAGLSSWGQDSPRYQLDSDGAVVHSGSFSDVSGPADRFRAALRQTHIYRNFFRNRVQADRDDVDLMVAVVAASEQQLKAMYPGVAFHIILWDNTSPKKVKQQIFDWLYSGLQQAGFQVHLASQMLPGYPQKHADYELSPEDNHPTARAYQKMAAYIDQYILAKPPADTAGHKVIKDRALP